MESIFVQRGRFEIIYDILAITKKPTNKTNILYKCNLSFSQLQKYLKYLRNKGLLDSSSNNGKMVYQATTKGKEFIKDYENLNRSLESSNKKEIYINTGNID
jgi:predicted transcriptional regulator